MPRVIVCSVNEQLLDLRALDPLFARVFGNGDLRRTRFNQMLQSALVSTVTDAYLDFGAIGVAAFEMTAVRQGISLADDDWRARRASSFIKIQ